jgi:hypothetical protein
MKKKNAQIQSVYPQIWGLEIWTRKCFRPHPQPPILISNLQGKMQVHKCVRTDETGIRVDKAKKKIKKIVFFVSVQTGLASARTHSRVCADIASVRTDGKKNLK